MVVGRIRSGSSRLHAVSICSGLFSAAAMPGCDAVRRRVSLFVWFVTLLEPATVGVAGVAGGVVASDAPSGRNPVQPWEC